MLNTVFNMAFSTNMVVSMISLGKETPIDKPYLVFQKLIANTYLPGAGQPGFRQKLEEMTQGSSVSGELLAYAAKELETDKLYFLLKAFLGTQEEEERYAFLADLEGDFTTGTIIRKSYRRVTGSLMRIQEFHGKAYGWTPAVSAETIYTTTQSGGYLLRTRIRSAIEFLDQLYQYGEAGKTRITELGKEIFEEDDTPELTDF